MLDEYLTQSPIDGTNSVDAVKYDSGNVWINATQCFSGVPKPAWEFFIGGYQSAQKWLKDREGRQLSFDEILHYQKIIVALVDTDRIMKGIDAVGL